MKIISLLLLSLTLASGAAEAKEKWVCMKDGSEVKVKGKNPKGKEKACEEKGGVWEKAHHEGHDKQSSGSGGAW